jgi:hypothetical protein
MAIAAERLETERNRIAATLPGEIDAAKETALLDEMVMDETKAFFQRLFGSAGGAKPPSGGGGG